MKTLARNASLAIIIAMTLLKTVDADTFIPYGSPNIDGTLGTSEWPALSHIRMARFYGSDQYSDIWLQWDDNNLYVSGIMEDKSIKEDGTGSGSIPFIETWHDDSLEIYLQPTETLSDQLNETARIVAFTPTGRFQRIDRGRWSQDASSTITTGLETFANTVAKINDTLFLNQAIPQNGVCPVEQPLFINSGEPVSIKFKNSQTPSQDWRFEMAIPWRLLGTKTDTKIVGGNCQLGNGIYPTRLVPKEGLSLALNFYRVGDDDGNDADPHFTGNMTDALGNQSPNGIMKDEWSVFQGDRYHPKEWMRFILSDQRTTHSGPIFPNATITSEPVSATDGRRARLHFQAPQRSTNDKSNATQYAVHFSEGQINVTTDTWDTLHEYQQSVKPLAVGQEQTIDVINLQPGKTYTFALRAIDEQGVMSQTILNSVLTMPNDTREPFVTVAPTGRNLVLSNGQPFVVAGETALMPWLPLRGLYDQDLCDEVPPDFLKHPPANFLLTQPKSCGNGILDRQGKQIDGLLRNYYTENIFYTCHFSDGSSKGIALLSSTDKPQDNCIFQETRQLNKNLTNNPEAVEGPRVAEDYFAKLQANNINVLTVFVESLDLNATPIMFEANDPKNQNTNDAALRFLDRLLVLAKKYNVYLLFRMYDDFYYKDSDSTGSNRKWSDTYWYKQLGKKSPDNFFDADIYSYHQQRMRVLLERYRDNPNVLGWDLLNEIDNKLRFNTASLANRQKWLEAMLPYAKNIDRNHLIFYSFLTWDPKDDSYYRAGIGEKTEHNGPMTKDKLIGMDATVAYRIQNSDLAMPHGYYAHVANPWETSDAEFSPPLELARGISYGFSHIQDGRPILDGESSPNTFLYQKSYGDDGFTETQDDLNFYRSAWLHFVSGGAGANLRWPSDLRKTNTKSSINQIGDTKRNYLKIFMSTVGALPWRGDLLEVDQASNPSSSSSQFIRRDGQSALIYLYNPNGENQQNITLINVEPNTQGSVKVIDPENGEILLQQDNVNLTTPIVLKKASKHDIVFIVTQIIKSDATSVLAGDYSISIPHLAYRNAEGKEMQLSAKLSLISSENGQYVFQLNEYNQLQAKDKTFQTASVDKDLNMNIPRLLFEFKGKKQFLHAKLKGVLVNGQLRFNVVNYGEL